MAYRVNSKVFETEAEARAFSRGLMARGGLGGWCKVNEPVSHIYKGNGTTEMINEIAAMRARLVYAQLKEYRTRGNTQKSQELFAEIEKCDELLAKQNGERG